MCLPADSPFLWKWHGALQQRLFTLESAPPPLIPEAQLLSLCGHTGCFRLCRERSLSGTQRGVQPHRSGG